MTINQRILIAIMFVNFSILLTLTYSKIILDFAINGWDTGIYEQVMWNMTQGKFSMPNSIEAAWLSQKELSHFAFHNQSVLYFLFPAYVLFPSPITLGILQVLIFSITPLPLYLLGIKKLKSSFLALAVVIVFLTYPYASGIVLNSYFHPEVFVIPLLIAAFYFMEEGRRAGYYVFILLILMCKESLALVVAIMGLYQLFVKKEQEGLLVTALGIGWFIANIYFIIPWFRGEPYQYIDRYRHLGDSFEEVLLNVFTHPSAAIASILQKPKVQYMHALFSGVGYISFLSPTTLLITLPTLLQNTLSNHPADLNLFGRDTSPLITPLFISLIYGLAKLKRLLEFISNKLNRFLNVTPYFILLFPIWIVWGNINSYRSNVLQHLNVNDSIIFSDASLKRQLEEQIPSEASLSIPSQLLPGLNLVHRRWCFPMPANYEVADYVVVAKTFVPYSTSTETYAQVRKDVEQGQKFLRVFENSAFVLYQNRKNGDRGLVR